MTADLRARIRQHVDAQARARLAAQTEAGCARCGADLSHRTLGCRACSDRHTKIKRRQDAAYRAAETLARRERRHDHAA